MGSSPTTSTPLARARRRCGIDHCPCSRFLGLGVHSLFKSAAGVSFPSAPQVKLKTGASIEGGCPRPAIRHFFDRMIILGLIAAKMCVNVGYLLFRQGQFIQSEFCGKGHRMSELGALQELAIALTHSRGEAMLLGDDLLVYLLTMAVTHVRKEKQCSAPSSRRPRAQPQIHCCQGPLRSMICRAGRPRRS